MRYDTVLTAATLALAATAATAAPWQYVSPAGARASTIADAGDRLLLGTAQDLHQSFDNGATWSRIGGFGRIGRPLDFAIDRHVAGHWYVSVQKTTTLINGQGIPVTYASFVRLETRDAGATWSPAPFSSQIALPVFHPVANSGMTWLYYTWYLSNDGGSWLQQARSPEVIASVVGLPLPGHPFGAMTFSETNGTNDLNFRLTTGSGLSAPLAAVPADSSIHFDTPDLQSRRLAPAQAYWVARRSSETRTGTIDFATGDLVSFPTVNGYLWFMSDDPVVPGGAIGLYRPPNDGPCASCVRYRVDALGAGATQWQARGSIDIGQKHGDDEEPKLLAGSGGRLLIADRSVGVRASDDGGATWSASQTGLGEVLVNAVLIDPRNPQLLLAGRDMQSLQRSADGGATWSDVGGQVPHDVRAFARSPVDADHLVATAADGLYRSRDGGATWQSIPTTLPSPPATTPGWRQIAWCENDDMHLIVAAGRALYRSADAGVSWTLAVDRPSQNSPFGLETASVVPGRTYFTQADGTWHASDDCGATSTAMNGIRAVLAVDPNDSRHLVANTIDQDGYYVSNDGGSAWIRLADPVASSSPGINPMKNWIDACMPSRFTTSRLQTTQGAGFVAEPPGLSTWLSDVRAVDSRCNGSTSFNVVATSAGGLWVSVADLDAIFANGFEND